MELNKKEIYKCLNSRKFKISHKKLRYIVHTTFDNTRRILYGYKFETKNNTLNPLLWEYGHFIYFWTRFIIKNLQIKDKNVENIKIYLYKLKLYFNKNGELYDSHKTSKEFRYSYYQYLIPNNKLNMLMADIYNLIICVIKHNYNKINSYLIYLGCIHQNIQNEVFLFNYNNAHLNLPPTIRLNFDKVDSKLYKSIEMIKIKGGKMKQGVSKKTSKFYFDNEYPTFNIKIKDFYVSRHCITNNQYLDFVNDNGYNNKYYWSKEGWDFIKKNHMRYPKFWLYGENKQFYEIVFGKYYLLRDNYPVMVSWYEARAFCRWNKSRLLTESEWEYLADNNDNAVFDYNEPVSVIQEKNKNRHGVYGLYGNYWEWCDNSIYPYDGYIIDPVDRHKSFSSFGYKKICRGGAWCVPKYLATRTYRNSQFPDCNYQFITFRVAM